jgi:tetratricopeptide (TPR) repeat protein
MKDRLGDAHHDLRRASDYAQRARIERDIATLEVQIGEQQRIVDDPVGTAARGEESIQHALDLERKPTITSPTFSKFVNVPPAIAPAYFQDRHDQTKRIGRFLNENSLRLMTIVGRGGIGKTALVCRLLKSVESGRLPDEGEPLFVDGIVYLSLASSRRITMFTLYADLCKLLPDSIAADLELLYKKPQVTTEAKMEALLAAIPQGRIVLLLDNFEDAIDPESRTIRDSEMYDGLRSVLTLSPHSVKVILTSRIPPQDLALVEPGRQTRLDLDEGLNSRDADRMLREMDEDGTLGLKSASLELLEEACARTRGYPRALEALFGILSADRNTSLPEILADSEGSLPENVVEVLVGQAFNRLDATAQRAMQALAVIGRPVPAVAVDYLLHPYMPGANSSPVLGRLLNMKFVRKEASRYYLHPVDREYALGRVPTGERGDCRIESRPFTQFALRDLAAQYFHEIGKPRTEWKTLDDLEPQLSEFDFRCANGDYDEAAKIVDVIHYNYLYVWGHYQRMVDLHERLRGNIRDLYLKERILGHLGIAYGDLGRISKAIDATQEALAVARSAGNTVGEVLWLGNLGTFFRDVGNTTHALKFFTDAQSANHSANRFLQAVNLIYQGECYGDLGESKQAIGCFQKGISLLHQCGHPNEPARTAMGLADLAQVLFDLGQREAAMDHAYRAVQLGGEANAPKPVGLGNIVVALACLTTDDLPAARAAAEAAVKCDLALLNHVSRTVLGIVTIRRGDLGTARTILADAIADAKAVLKVNPQAFRALDSIGIALAATECCSNTADVSSAALAHQRARRINSDAGIITQILRLYDALTPIDVQGITAPARTAACGQ